MNFDPQNYISIMVHICDTFALDHQQMMTLRAKVEKAFAAQPAVFVKKSPAPVTLNAVAITYGLLVGFGGLSAALDVSGERVVKVARGYDPFGHLDPQLQKQMHRKAQANRRARGW